MVWFSSIFFRLFLVIIFFVLFSICYVINFELCIGGLRMDWEGGTDSKSQINIVPLPILLPIYGQSHPQHHSPIVYHWEKMQES